MRATLPLAISTLLITAACSSGSSVGHASHTAGGTTPTVATSASGHTGGIAFTGAFSGTMSITLCNLDAGSVEVHVTGDSTTYHGLISGRSFGFVGPEAADYTLKSGQAKPTVTANSSTFTVKDAQLTDLVSGKTVTASGTVSCP